MVNAGNHDVNEDPDRVTVGGQETGLTTFHISLELPLGHFSRP